MTRRDTGYEQLTDRNRGLILPGEQKRIKRCHVVVPGLGMGAVIAEMLVRKGIIRLSIADGDNIEHSNLNRQPWFREDVGHSKAETTAVMLRSINPHVRLRVRPEMLTPADIPDFVRDAHVIINAIGVEALPLVVELHRYARANRIWVIEPMNFGWGGGVFVFGPDGTTFEEMIDLKPGDDLQALADNPVQMLPYWQRLAEQHLPEYLRGQFQKFLRGVQQQGWCAIPQLVAGVHITAAIAVTTLVQMVLKKPVKMAPEFISLDPLVACMPAGFEK